MARITNLVQYPKTTSARAVLNLTAGNAGWGGTGSRTMTPVADATAPSGGGYWSRVANSASGTTDYNNLAGTSSVTDATAGQPYSGIIYVRSNEPLKVALRLVPTSGAQGTITGLSVTLVPGQIIPLTASGVATATTTGFNVQVVSTGEVAYTASCVLDIDAAFIEQSATLSRDWFDGDTPTFRYGPLAQIVTPKWAGTAGQSSSYFDYEEPWTPNMQWDTDAGRAYELGVDRGVLYPKTGSGVAWNGLVRVTEKQSGVTITPYYQDGVKYYNDSSVPEFSATIEAFTYPDVFQEYTGYVKTYNGLYFGDQPIQPFGLAYRTKIGDGIYGPDIFYKIHLVYNAMAIPSDRGYSTVNASPEAATFTWDIQTLPIVNDWHFPTSHLVIDSRKFTATKLKAFETILYGTSSTAARLPLPAEVRSILA